MSTIKVMLVGGPGAGRVYEVHETQRYIYVPQKLVNQISAFVDHERECSFEHATYVVKRFVSQPNSAGGPAFHYLATHDDRDMMAELIEVYGANKRIDARERWAGRIEGFEWALKVMCLGGATGTPTYARMLLELEKLKQEAKCE